MIKDLINKQDSFEVIRDEIASILTLETASQMALAKTAGECPDLWDLNVYVERSNPWERWLNDPDDISPIINVWYDNSNFDPSGSNVMQRQKTTGIFNIDCYGYGITYDTTAGHMPGDLDAAKSAQRAVRLVRNILMASEYTYLGLRGLVWSRWPQSITLFQPQLGDKPVQRVVGARLAFQVVFNEFSPQYVPETLEYVSTLTTIGPDGLVTVGADYDFS